MKTALTLLLFLFGLTVSAQTWVGQSSNTFYVIPPTSGCNGVWALDSAQWPCSGFCTYAISPFGCATSCCGPIVGDTVFLSLCSVPCNITINCGPYYGTCGTGMPPTTTGIASIDNISKFKVYPNPANTLVNYEIELANSETGFVRLLDVLGNEVLSYKLDSGMNKGVIDLTQFTNGVYMYKIIINNEFKASNKLVITK